MMGLFNITGKRSIELGVLCGIMSQRFLTLMVARAHSFVQ